uniref:Protein YOP1 n=1 Tax=Mycena chlorophos TaxID=658473 RepID=A0ABQ0L9S5_MYCCL|nr:predicted protein [Mycena chlorophos]
MNFVVHLIAAWFAFLLPVFATFKSLSHPTPTGQADLARWCKYWCVLGLVVAFEYLGEFLISWVPFYSEIKIVFLLFLALPQTQGSTYVYDTLLAPWLSQHEAALDADILAIQRNFLNFAQTRLASLWHLVVSALNKNASSGQASGAAPAGLNLDTVFRTLGPLMSSFQGAQPAPAAVQTPGAAPEAQHAY